jgi:hypothetical protein
MRSTSLAAIALVAFVAAMATSARADQYRWCGTICGDGGGGGTNCGFVTYQQCMDHLSGNGGFCEPNPFYTGGGASRAQASPADVQRAPRAVKQKRKAS